MQLVCVVTAGLQFADDFAHALQVVAVSDQHCVRSVDDDQIFNTNRGNHPVFGMDKSVAGRDRHPGALSAVAFGIGLA